MNRVMEGILKNAIRGVNQNWQMLDRLPGKVPLTQLPCSRNCKNFRAVKLDALISCHNGHLPAPTVYHQ